MRDPAKEYAKMVKRYADHGDTVSPISAHFLLNPKTPISESWIQKQEFGLKQLIELAKAAGRPSARDFLLQFGIKIPTTRFKVHYQAVLGTITVWKDRVNALKLNLQEELKNGETPELLDGLDLVEAALQHITNADEHAYLAAVQQIEALVGPAQQTTGQ